MKLVQLITLQWPLKYLSERKSCTPLTLNQKLEMIQLSGEGVLKAEAGRKRGLLGQMVARL